MKGARRELHKKWMMLTLGLVVVLSTLISLVACGPQPTQAPVEAPEEAPEEAPAAEEMEPNYFVRQWEALGGEMVGDEAFKTGDVEFRAQLTSIKDAEPDVIVMPFLAKEVALAAKQARDLGITVPFIGGDGWPSPTLLEMAASAVEGCYFVDHTNVNAEHVQDYRAAYQERFGSDIQVNAIMTHDAVLVLAAAIEKAGSADPVKIRDALEQLDPVEGFTGNITIDPEMHNPVGKSAVIMTIKDGEFEFYTVVEPVEQAQTAKGSSGRGGLASLLPDEPSNLAKVRRGSQSQKTVI